MIKQTLEKVEANGDEVRLTVLLDKEDLVKEYGGISYELQGAVRNELTPMLVKEIMDKHKEEIINKVLSEVDWPEIVRSEVAQRVIQEVASGRKNY